MAPDGVYDDFWVGPRNEMVDARQPIDHQRRQRQLAVGHDGGKVIPGSGRSVNEEYEWLFRVTNCGVEDLAVCERNDGALKQVRAGGEEGVQLFRIDPEVDRVDDNGEGCKQRDERHTEPQRDTA